MRKIFWVKQKSLQSQKHRERGFPQLGKGIGKHNHFKFMGFSNILGEAEIHAIPKLLGKVNLLFMGKVWENTDFPYSLLPCRFRV